MNIGPSFIILEFYRIYYEFLMNLQAYEYFLHVLTKFIRIWNHNSYSLFEFTGLNQIHSITKFVKNSNQNWIWIEILFE
jgi:hypothetical protein